MYKTAAFSLCLLLATFGCSTYREDLNRGQRFYEDNRYENALALFRVLENDVDSLEANDQARYAYLRGMTDYRLGFRADSRHWLALAKATDEQHPGGLNGEWKQRLEDSLADLNQDVYGGGETLAKPDAAAGSSPDAGTCHTDADCGANTTCRAGRCAPP